MEGVKGAECRHFTVVCLSCFADSTMENCKDCNTCQYCGKVVQ